MPDWMMDEIDDRRHSRTDRSEWIRGAIQARLDAEDRGDWEEYAPGDNEHEENDEEQLRADGGRPTEEEMLDVELVLGAGRLYDHQVRLDVSAAEVVNREEGRLEISLADSEMDEYLAELGLKNRTDEFATDGGQLTRQQRQAEKLQLKHAAEQGREQRLQTALETAELGKQGQRIWIIPEFEPDEAESDYIQDSVREALPEYDLKVVVDRTKPITKDRIHDILLGSGDGEEDDVRTDGGRSAGNPETRLGEARKQLRIVLDYCDECVAETLHYRDETDGMWTCASCGRWSA
jgi:hypothetical protein